MLLDRKILPSKIGDCTMSLAPEIVPNNSEYILKLSGEEEYSSLIGTHRDHYCPN